MVMNGKLSAIMLSGLVISRNTNQLGPRKFYFKKPQVVILFLTLLPLPVRAGTILMKTATMTCTCWTDLDRWNILQYHKITSYIVMRPVANLLGFGSLAGNGRYFSGNAVWSDYENDRDPDLIYILYSHIYK